MEGLTLSILCTKKRPCEDTKRRCSMPSSKRNLIRNHNPCHNLYVGLPASRTVRKLISVALATQFMVFLLWPSKQTET